MTLARSSLSPGFIALHGNRTEDLLDTVAAWLAQHPLDPLEPEIVLVQSNGMTEWVKMALAQQARVCAATTVQLPARFQWQTYRQVLGRARVPGRSPLDKTPLAWRLMHWLPQVQDAPGFEPVAGYLAGQEPGRTWQLAQRIADLFDQYQVHRPDWLARWRCGDEVLLDAGGRALPLPADQRWQARLWQQLLAELSAEQHAVTRAELHAQTLQALQDTAHTTALPRRVVLFGMTHVPLPILELLAALSRHCQVLLAIPNPCRFHWADILDGREWLRQSRQRQPLRHGTSLAQVPLAAMHLHAHPLLAAWGRQARDFVRQLDAFDDAEQTRARFPLARIDLFDDDVAADASLLTQVQSHIRDLLPLAEHPHAPVPATDRSVVFHIAHSPVRELEVLHDQLLERLAQATPAHPLQPRDIVVMVPEIDLYAPAIRAVFGQYGTTDPRHIPFNITDLSARASSPLLTALTWLLQLHHDRCRLSDLSGLLEVPAIAARFGLQADDLPQLTHWMNGAGMRWGLDAAHRAALGLASCGDQNTLVFGLRRMLMGYASGAHHAEPFARIEPYDEVGGLDAELAGSLARLLHVLVQWQALASQATTPAEWAARFRELLATLVLPVDDADRQTLAALTQALVSWVEACDDAGYAEPVPLTVAADAWLATLELPALEQRFRGGGVTFCTLMPMRAIPFQVVCLLGMNEGDYPRRSPRTDFDLMALPGQQRPGDRARRDDDRQLMLEALLSARQALHVSWCGFSVRDNTPQPPSVLVAQLRDYLATGWSPDVVAQRTTEHPLQPFSRRYFETDSPLRTYAREWRAAHLAAAPAAADVLPAFQPDPAVALSVAQLARFLRNPVQTFFQQRLGVHFQAPDETLPDLEAFALDGLERYAVMTDLLAAVRSQWAGLAPATLTPQVVQAALAQQLQRLQDSGRLPLGALGGQARARLANALEPLLLAWVQTWQEHPWPAPRLELRASAHGLTLADWLDHRLTADPAADPIGLSWRPSQLLEKPARGEPWGRPRADLLLEPWLRCLLQAAAGQPGQTRVLGLDATLVLTTPDPADASRTLATLLQGWRLGLDQPQPVAVRTALAWLSHQNPDQTYDGNAHGSRDGEGAEPSLARLYPDFASLQADGRFAQLASAWYDPLLQWVGSHVTVQPHATGTFPAPEADT